MPMSVTGNNRRARTMSATSVMGFTLLEMLAVIVLLAFAAAAMTMATSRGLDNARAEKACRGTALMLRAARARALSTGVPQSVSVDVAGHRVIDAWRQVHRLPANIAIAMQGASQLTSAGEGAIAFAGDGSASGGHIDLQHDGRICRIDVSWLTGAVEVSQTTGSR